MLRFLSGVLVGGVVSAIAMFAAMALKPIDLPQGPQMAEIAPFNDAQTPNIAADLPVPPALPQNPRRIELALPAEVARPKALAADVPQDLRRIALVLRDGGQMKDAGFALAALPFPVAVVLDAQLPDAATRMAAYRANGIEVLSLGEETLPESTASAQLSPTGLTISGLSAVDAHLEGKTADSLAVGDDLSRLISEGASTIVLDLRPDVLAGMRIFAPAQVAIVPISQLLPQP